MNIAEVPEVLPPNSHLGSDGRPHHFFGFSFATVLEKCPAARRSKTSAANLKQAGERGVELHGVLEDLVQDWVDSIQVNPQTTLQTCYDFNLKKGRYNGKPVADLTSLKKIVEEITPFLSPEPGMLLGTEERIDLYGPPGEDGEKGDIVSFGWYDLFLKLGKTVLIIDHKFVRKEVDAAEKNRQGHCFAVSVWQAYDDVEDVVVLFTMPECGSSIHRFTRVEDETRITQELWEIFTKVERPYKRLQAGDHCVYCKFRNDCEAVLSEAKTVVTAILPLAVPPVFAPHLIKTAEDMTVLRYWADTLLPFCEAVKDESKKWAQNGQAISATINGELIEYRVQTRKLPRKIGEPLEIWNLIKDWMPPEAMLQACKVGITDLETVVLQLMTARILDEGGTPDPKKIAETFTNLLMNNNLLTREDGHTIFLQRVKASAKGKKQKSLTLNDGAPRPPIDSDDN